MITTRKCLALLLPFLLIFLTGGCATGYLWSDNSAQMDAWKQPADNPNLRLYQSKTQTNLLVVFDQYSERSEAIRTRAYWLAENESRVENRQAPRYARTQAARDLPVVPVFYETNSSGMNLPPNLCAVVTTNKQAFTLYQAGSAIGSYKLPTYKDGKGQLERIALTPVALTADATIVAGVLAYIYAEGLADSPPH